MSAAEQDTRAGGMIETLTGKYALSDKNGEWTYERIDHTSGNVLAKGELVGTFTYTPIDEKPVLDGVFSWDQDLKPNQDMRCIGITNGEIMADIQLPENEGAYFILPSQLNGAEYPSERSIVENIQEYIYDNTGGPRGQLAVHPAAGSFVLQNAANERNVDGICAIDGILVKTGDPIHLQNGYMALPKVQDDEEKAKKVFEDFTGALHTLRPLIMHEVPASGLTPNKRAWSTATHKVGLVYSSAVPLSAYLNMAKSATEMKLHKKMAEAILVAQYYGALRQIATRFKDTPKKKTRVYMLPLGGGVFNNPMDSIARAMAQAAELLATNDGELFNLLEMQALAWNGNPAEKTNLGKHIGMCKKLLLDGAERWQAPEAQKARVAAAASQETQQKSEAAGQGASSQQETEKTAGAVGQEPQEEPQTRRRRDPSQQETQNRSQAAGQGASSKQETEKTADAAGQGAQSQQETQVQSAPPASATTPAEGAVAPAPAATS